MCQDCPTNTFAESESIRLDGCDGCAPCVTCSAGKFLGGCSATAGPGGCEACPHGRFLEGGKCSGCCPAGNPVPDVDCSNVSQLLASGIVASVEALWAGKWKKEGVKRWQFTTQASVHSSPTLSPDGTAGEDQDLIGGWSPETLFNYMLGFRFRTGDCKDMLAMVLAIIEVNSIPRTEFVNVINKAVTSITKGFNQSGAATDYQIHKDTLL